MNKIDFKIINNVCIYPLDYFANQELTEYDLDNLFNGKSFLYSLIINMIQMSGVKDNENSIINAITTDSKLLKKYNCSDIQLNDILNKKLKRDR